MAVQRKSGIQTDSNQTLVAIAILALSVILSIRWDNLANACKGEENHMCYVVTHGAGAHIYCIAVGAYALVDMGVWAVDAFWLNMPWWVVYACAQTNGGMALGGGCVS